MAGPLVGQQFGEAAAGAQVRDSGTVQRSAAEEAENRNGSTLRIAVTAAARIVSKSGSGGFNDSSDGMQLFGKNS